MYWQHARSNMLSALLEKKRLGLVSDLDGTLSPIVPQPELARVTPRNLELLQEFAKRLPLVAVISGRSVRDIRKRVPIPGLQYVGNHGFERWKDGKVQVNAQVGEYRTQLKAAMGEIRIHLEPGAFIEDKGVTLSVHYRQTADPKAAGRRLLPHMQQIASSAELNLYQGRMVFEFRPPVQLDKGTAFRTLVIENAIEAALYLGDDTTDIAALEMAGHMRRSGLCYAVGVGVESAGTPAALLEKSDVWVSGVSGVESFLGWFLEALRASST